MASETPATGGFGQVSRVKGVLFEYLSLAASLIGIVALAILLGYVSVDAFGLTAAEPAWFLVYFLTLVVPTAAFAQYARGRPAVKDAALGLLTVILGGTLATLSTIIVVSVIVGPDVWFAHVVLILGVPLAFLGYARYDPSAAWAGTAAGLAFVAGLVMTAIDDVLLAFGRQLASPVDVVSMPEDVLLSAAGTLGVPGVYFLTLLLPGTALAARYVSNRRGERAGRLTAVLIVGAAFLGVPVVDTLPFISRGSWLIVLTGFVTPVAAFAALNAPDRDRQIGLSLPLVVIAGSLLGALLVDLLDIAKPEPWFDWQFVTSAPSSTAANAGLYPAIIGSIFIIVLVALFTIVFGVGAAIYLEEYARSTGPVGTLTRFIQINISNLAGVPSIVYGLLGLGLFIKLVGIGFGTVLVAAMTLSLLILPIVIISAQEAIRSVPDDMRQASYGMGATRWQTIRTVVLPESLPAILTGTILALGRAIGETAPLILIGIPHFVTQSPDGMLSRTTAMPMLIYEWAFYPQADFRYGVVAASVVTLLAVLLSMNSVAIYVRNKYERSS